VKDVFRIEQQAVASNPANVTKLILGKNDDDEATLLPCDTFVTIILLPHSPLRSRKVTQP
jgi:hypothetical protein